MYIFPGQIRVFTGDAGMNNQYDRIEKEDSNYLGVWIYWTVQKDAELGIMRVYKNGELFAEAFNDTRPFGGPVENLGFRSGRLGGLWWDGWVDEFRIGLFMESAESIKASYDSQRPDAVSGFSAVSTVEGPPLIMPNQKVKDMRMIHQDLFHISFQFFHQLMLFRPLVFLQV